MFITAAMLTGIAVLTLPVFADDEDITYHDSADEAAAELREAMKQRSAEVTIGLTGRADQDILKQAIGKLLKQAVEHTGEPDEGDYINFQYAVYKGSATTTSGGDYPAVKITYKLSYYDTADQEAEVDNKVEEIIDGLDLEGRSDYEKLVAIYDYICDNTEYETAEEGDNTRRTAYGALIEKKAVCQGYSLALYRLLLEAGIDNRIIFGTGIDPAGEEGAHTWNIVCIYGKYYYVDPTWDDSTGSRDNFMRHAGSGFEDTHIPGDEYPEDFFTVQYEMADSEFPGDLKGFGKQILVCVEYIDKAIRKAAAKAAI